MRPGRAALALVAAVALAGCTNGGGTGDSARSAPPGSSGAASPSVASPSVASPPAAPATPPTARGDCVASVEEATVRPAEPPGATCLVAGATLRITSAPAPARPWQPLNVSDPKVLECASTVAGDGSISGSCTARRAGTAVLSTTARRGPGEPYDHVWQLTVRVVA